MLRTTLLLIAFVAACGSSSNTNHYAKAKNDQLQCCNQLADQNERGQCVRQIPSVDKEFENVNDVQRISQCMDKHFTCDVRTGKPTQESAQAQYDCIRKIGLASR